MYATRMQGDDGSQDAGRGRNASPGGDKGDKAANWSGDKAAAAVQTSMTYTVAPPSKSCTNLSITIQSSMTSTVTPQSKACTKLSTT
jgi:hypothetical protein